MVVPPLEKWLRLVTSIGALAMDSWLFGALMPLVSNWKWASTGEITHPSGSSEPNHTAPMEGDSEGGPQTSLLVGIVFFIEGALELVLAPVAGLVSDRLGFDSVILFGLLVAILQSLVFGLSSTTLGIVSVNRLLQGVIGACLQPISIARIKDLYDQPSREYIAVLGIAASKICFSYFGGLFVGVVFPLIQQRVYLLFLPVLILLSLGVLMTIRTDNVHCSHSKGKTGGSKDNCAIKPSKNNVDFWTVMCDLQIVVLTLCSFVTEISRASLEPSLAVWMQFTFRSDQSTIAHVFGLCGVSIVLGNVLGAWTLPVVFPGRSWIAATTFLSAAGLPMLFLSSCNGVVQASIALIAHYTLASVVRLALTSMCSTLASHRYPDSYGLVFAVFNAGTGGALLAGPFLSTLVFSPACGACFLGAACVISAPSLLLVRNLEDDVSTGLDRPAWCLPFMGKGRNLKTCDKRLVIIVTAIQVTYRIQYVQPQLCQVESKVVLFDSFI